jgi:uncharacterized phiE125 gp8 family phage protein
MADLTSTDSVKTYLGIDAGETADDALLTRLVTAASDFITRATGRVWVPTDFTETQSGSGGSVIFPNQYPVISVSSVTIDGAAIPARAEVTGSGWVLDGDVIRLIGYTVTPGVANVAIVYRAGLASVPTDVEQAVIELAAYRYKVKDRMSIASKSLPAGEVVSFVGYSASTASVDAVIEHYRRPGVA